MDITSRYGMPKWMKIALITAGVMNMLGAVLFSVRRISSRGKRLPAGSHPLYLSIISSWILLFGFAIYG